MQQHVLIIRCAAWPHSIPKEDEMEEREAFIYMLIECHFDVLNHKLVKVKN